MFFEGDLKSGITKAVNESKLVACFVTDEGHESKIWEEDFLQDTAVIEGLSSHAVLLRLHAGSPEAGFLSAIYPLPKTPTLVIIRDGALKEYLVSGVTRKDFLHRLGLVILNAKLDSTSRSGAPPPVPSSLTREEPLDTSNEQAPSHATDQQANVVQALLTERGIRLEAERREHDAKEKAKRDAIAKATKEVLAATKDSSEPVSAANQHALVQKKRQDAARSERARIMKRIEDDKASRKERETKRQIQNQPNSVPEQSSTASTSMSQLPKTECALQIRLFDGSTIRSRFPSQGTLRTHVKPWVDEHQTSELPYMFKHVLTPYPNRNLEISEEEQSLQSLGLPPNATLITIPISGYTSVYGKSTSRSLIVNSISAIVSLIYSGLTIIPGLLRGVLSATTPRETLSDEPPSHATARNARIRTIADHADSENTQLYNGNALNFEPRDDSNDKKLD